MRDLTLSKKLAAATEKLLERARNVEDNLSDVDYCTRMASFHDRPDIMEYQIMAGESCENARKQLAEFDRELANLMVLRGRLAEVTDIPMFSHIGEDQRFPNRDVYDM